MDGRQISVVLNYRPVIWNDGSIRRECIATVLTDAITGRHVRIGIGIGCGRALDRHTHGHAGRKTGGRPWTGCGAAGAAPGAADGRGGGKDHWNQNFCFHNNLTFQAEGLIGAGPCFRYCQYLEWSFHW